MSRTYRRNCLYLDINDKSNKENWFHSRDRSWGELGHCDYYSKRNYKYDRKNWGKSPSSFKKVMEKGRKAKVKQAMIKENYDNVPHFKNENDWLWH